MVKFKKGDAVIEDAYGVGCVVSVKSGIPSLPIEVEFRSDNSVVQFTNDGREAVGHPITLKKDTHTWKP